MTALDFCLVAVSVLMVIDASAVRWLAQPDILLLVDAWQKPFAIGLRRIFERVRTSCLDLFRILASFVAGVLGWQTLQRSFVNRASFRALGCGQHPGRTGQQEQGRIEESRDEKLRSDARQNGRYLTRHHLDLENRA
jgi:hypothetical protein